MAAALGQSSIVSGEKMCRFPVEKILQATIVREGPWKSWDSEDDRNRIAAIFAATFAGKEMSIREVQAEIQKSCISKWVEVLKSEGKMVVPAAIFLHFCDIRTMLQEKYEG